MFNSQEECGVGEYCPFLYPTLLAQQLARDGHVTQAKTILNSFWDFPKWSWQKSLLAPRCDWILALCSSALLSGGCISPLNVILKGLLVGPSCSSLLVLDDFRSLLHKTSWFGIWHHQTTYCHSELSAFQFTFTISQKIPYAFLHLFLCTIRLHYTGLLFIIIIFDKAVSLRVKKTSKNQCSWHRSLAQVYNMNDCLTSVHLCESSVKNRDSQRSFSDLHFSVYEWLSSFLS